MPPKGTKKKNPKERVWVIRVTEKEDNRARILARMYAGGNLSRWIIHGALNGERRSVVKGEKKE